MEKKEIILENNTQDEKEFKRNRLFFSTGGIGRDMVYSLVSGYFFMYVQFGLTLTVAQFATLSILIGVLGRIWDGINDPLMGTIIDNAKFKWGKFKPWIFIGSILTSILLLIMFNLRPFGSSEMDGWIYVGLMVVIYLLWEAAFTMNDIGYWGAIPSLSRTKERRDSLTSMVIFFAGIGAGLVGIVVGVFSPGNILTAYTIYSIIAAVMMVGCQTMVCFTVKEGPRDDENEEKEKGTLIKTFKIIFHNKQLLIIALGYLIYDIGSGILGALIYNLYYLEYGYDGTFAIVITVMGGITMVLQTLYPKITKNWTREKIQRIAVFAMIIGYAIIALIGWTNFLPFTPITLGIGYIFISVGGTYFYISSLINLTNCVEYNEYLTGERNEAIVSSVRPLLVKFASATKSLFTTLVLIFSGLYVLSQDVSNLETQRNLVNDKILKEINNDSSDVSFDELKEYVIVINTYASSMNQLEKDSLEYNTLVEEINAEINTLDGEHILAKVQARAEYFPIYQQMYFLKKQDGKVVDHKQIKEFGSTSDASLYFEEDYEYEAAFVVNYEKEDGTKIDINIGTQVYKQSDTLSTRIILRIMVTILPILIIILSYYIQNKKYIVNEEFYDKMMLELEKRRKSNN